MPSPTWTPGTPRVAISEPMNRLIAAANAERAEAGHLQLENEQPEAEHNQRRPVMFTGST